MGEDNARQVPKNSSLGLKVLLGWEPCFGALVWRRKIGQRGREGNLL
jgi:hypothetical protein